MYDALSAAHRALCEPIGEVKVKGKVRPVRIYGVRDGAQAAAEPAATA